MSYKPQKISPKHQGTVRQLLHERIRDAYVHPQFVTDVLKPLQIEPIFDQEASHNKQARFIQAMLLIVHVVISPELCGCCCGDIQTQTYQKKGMLEDLWLTQATKEGFPPKDHRESYIVSRCEGLR